MMPSLREDGDLLVGLGKGAARRRNKGPGVKGKVSFSRREPFPEVAGKEKRGSKKEATPNAESCPK